MPKPTRKQRWSNIDVFGLVKGLGIWDNQYKTLQYVRRPFDTPLTIKDKIQRLNDNKPSLTEQGLLNGLSVEFGLDSYNRTSRNIFQLTYNPIASGNLEVQDIFVKYRTKGTEDAWTDLLPQVWGPDYTIAKNNNYGFIVWTQDNYVNIDDTKNFNYTRTLEIIKQLKNSNEDILDNQEIQVTYYINIYDEYNNKTLVQFTDSDNFNDPNDTRFLYRAPVNIPLLSGITVYKLDQIPETLYDKYYNSEGHATNELYQIKKHFQQQYNYTWDKIKNNTSLWDMQDIYGSGEIPNFYDAWIPKNDAADINSTASLPFKGYIDGIDYFSTALYLSEIVEMDTPGKEWYPKIYPGRFYIAGVPFRMFEDPKTSGILFTNGVADLPSGLERGMYTILALSGYYNGSQDEFLTDLIFEDYCEPVGKGGDELFGQIYRHRPFLKTTDGYNIILNEGEYNIDYKERKIYLNENTNPNCTLIWENALLPSGRIIEYDLNPLNISDYNKQKIFLYINNKGT